MAVTDGEVFVTRRPSTCTMLWFPPNLGDCQLQPPLTGPWRPGHEMQSNNNASNYPTDKAHVLENYIAASRSPRSALGIRRYGIAACSTTDPSKHSKGHLCMVG